MRSLQAASLIALLAAAPPVLLAQRSFPRTAYLITIGQGSVGDSSSGPTASASILHSLADPLLIVGRLEGYAGTTSEGSSPTRRAAVLSGGLQLVTTGRWANWLLHAEAGPATMVTGGSFDFAWFTAAGVGVELPLGPRTALYADLRLGVLRSPDVRRFTGGSIGVRF